VLIVAAGADLSNLLNEAAILTGRRNKEGISQREIDDSIDRIVAGMEGTPMTDGRSKMLVAYHEVRAALCRAVPWPACECACVCACRRQRTRHVLVDAFPSTSWVLNHARCPARLS
jgi:hypothetical protein